MSSKVIHREPAIAPEGSVRLIGRPEVLDKTGLSYVAIWKLMVAGKFPRSKAVGERSMWIESEVDRWIAALPTRKLKGDDNPEAVPVCYLQNRTKDEKARTGGGHRKIAP
jgi:predicted DNA-binding transcriptional regulator AlpA